MQTSNPDSYLGLYLVCVVACCKTFTKKNENNRRRKKFSDYSRDPILIILRDRVACEKIGNLLNVISSIAYSHKIPFRAIIDFEEVNRNWIYREDWPDLMKALPIRFFNIDE